MKGVNTMRLKVVNKTRLITVLLLTLVCAIIFVGCNIHHSNKLKTEWEQSRDVITVTVHYGDTLDDFGYQYKPSWMDIREYRELVNDLNGMTSSALHTNTDIKLYAQGDDK